MIPRDYRVSQEQVEKIATDLFGPYYGGVLSEQRGALQTLINAVLEQALNEQWKPIEDAPTDGTTIILTNGKDVASGWWWDCEDYTGWMDCEGGMQPDPTLWMHMPAAHKRQS